MAQLKSILACLLLAILSGCALYLTRDLHRMLTWTATASYNTSAAAFALQQDAVAINGPCESQSDSCGLLGQIGNAVQTTSEQLNRPCGDGHPCGTLATINKTVVKAGDAVVTTQAQEKAVIPPTLTLLDSFTTTANAATGTARGLTRTLQTVDTTVDSLRAPVAAFTRDADDLHDILQQNAIRDTLANVNGMTSHGNAILGDAQKVADKMTADYLKPVPWWKQPIAKGGELIDITAAIARHVP